MTEEKSTPTWVWMLRGFAALILTILPLMGVMFIVLAVGIIPNVWLEKDNDLLLEVIPRILEIETGYTGVTTATISFSMHRTDTISKFETLGFRKMRESISMTKRL